jgi:predicted RNA-binding protein YlxR (DUF448 family)
MGHDSKQHMLRIVESGDTLTLDEEGRMGGRGAYLHYRNRCITDFVRSRGSDLRSLKRKVSRDERLKLAELIHERLDNIAAK